MSNKEFYKTLGIKTGDTITTSQMAQINQMKQQSVSVVNPASDKKTQKSSDEDIRTAVEMLDPENDSDWTTKGAPSMAAVEAMTDPSVTRKDVERVCPGYERP